MIIYNAKTVNIGPRLFDFNKCMYVYVADSQAATILLVPQPVTSQHVGYTATSRQLGSTSISFTYCIPEYSSTR